MGWLPGRFERHFFQPEHSRSAAVRPAGVRKWSYVNGILKVWKNEGVRTLGDVHSRDERSKPAADQQPKRSAAEDYDFIFGGSNDS